MQHKIGVHYIPSHGRRTDLAFMEALQPPWVKIVGGSVPDVDIVCKVGQAAPGAMLMLRDHALSEQKDDQRKAPRDTGRRHAENWGKAIAAQRQEAKRRGLVYPDNERLCILGINEPVLDAGEHIPSMKARAEELDIYTESLCDTARTLGLKVGAFNLSVGWPTNWDLPSSPNPGAMPDWTSFPRSYAAIVRGNHVLVLHEYWADKGPKESWHWWGGRFLRCPWNVPIVIGEAGIDMGVKAGGLPFDKRGWQAVKPADQYVAELREYHEELLRDGRVKAMMPYTTDYGSPEWKTFDTEPVQPALVAYAREVEQRSAYATWKGIVTADNGLFVRSQASQAGQVLGGMAKGTVVNVEGQAGEWLRVTAQVNTGTLAGWAHGQYIARQDVPTPDAGDFERIMDFVLRWEGGLSLDPNDRGNWTGGQVGSGELKGTKYGISAASYPKVDIRNLTVEQARSIYYKDYWLASGAHNLAWPLNLAHMDAAVQHGVGTVNKWKRDNFAEYMGNRIRFYTQISTWNLYGNAWMKRMADVLSEAGK